VKAKVREAIKYRRTDAAVEKEARELAKLARRAENTRKSRANLCMGRQPSPEPTCMLPPEPLDRPAVLRWRVLMRDGEWLPGVTDAEKSALLAKPVPPDGPQKPRSARTR
jgi:hypothetical protein